MALSGSLGNTFRTGYRIQIDWTAVQDIINNCSTITAKFYLVSLGSSYTISSSAAKTVRNVIEGSTYVSAEHTGALSGNQKKLMATSTKTVYHNSDGTEHVEIGGNIDLNVTLSGVYWGNISIPVQEFTLDTIPRATQISYFPNFTIGNPIHFHLDRKYSGYHHHLSLRYNNEEDIIAWREGLQVDEYNLVLTEAELDDLYAKITTSTEGWVALRMDTYNGDTFIGSAEVKWAKATIPSSVKPILGTISHHDEDAYIDGNLGGVHIQGLSKIHLSLTGNQNSRGCTANFKVTLELDGRIYEDTSGWANLSFISEYLRGSGTLRANITITDSRGRSSSGYIDLTVRAYSPPVITAYAVKRCNEEAVLDSMGTHLLITMAGSASSVIKADNVTEANFITYKVWAKERGTSEEYTLRGWQAQPGLTVNKSVLNGVEGTYAIDKAYDVMLELVDELSQSSSVIYVPTSEVVMSLSKSGVSFGKIWEKGVIDARGSSYFEGLIENIGKTVIKGETIPASRVRFIRDWLDGNSTNAGNHWVEIEAWRNTTGTNIAEGKTVTCKDGDTGSNLSRITDGIIGGGSDEFASVTPSVSGSPTYVQVDLGQVFNDIDCIKVVHYYADGRTYQGTKTEVAEFIDGPWYTIFDSEVSGEYVETWEGNNIYQVNATKEFLKMGDSLDETSRPWAFKQQSYNGGANLILQAEVEGKAFKLKNSKGNKIISFYQDDDGFTIGIDGEISQDPWIAPTLLNSWVNYNSTDYTPCGYMKDKQGFVHIRGLIALGSTVGLSEIFLLPEGYRPSHRILLAVASNDSFADIRIDPDGYVKVGSGVDNTWLSLENICFRP